MAVRLAFAGNTGVVRAVTPGAAQADVAAASARKIGKNQVDRDSFIVLENRQIVRQVKHQRGRYC